MTGTAPVAARDHGLVDIAVIGGGINGAGIARDAAGRGLRVLLCERDDFAEGTSSRSASSCMAASAISNITSFAWCERR